MEWISVEDRLPDEYERVLTFNPKYQNLRVELIRWFIGDEYDGITHWMLLPKPPEQ